MKIAFNPCFQFQPVPLQHGIIDSIFTIDGDLIVLGSVRTYIIRDYYHGHCDYYDLDQMSKEPGAPVALASELSRASCAYGAALVLDMIFPTHTPRENSIYQR
jgi:cytosine/uracil/thiamine/allantoin permease